MPDSLRVAVVQMNSREVLSANLEICQRLIGAAADQGARFVALPENFAFMGRETARRHLVEHLDSPGPILTALGQNAREHQVYLLAGGFPLASHDPVRPYNAACLFGPDGSILATYRKIHLFDVDAPDGKSYRESDGVTAGGDAVCVDVDGFRVGLSICYDVRFPELYRRLVDDGAEILCVPAAFTEATGKAHWHLLCRARAVESQCYLLAPGQYGTHVGERRTFGHSLIVDPWGELLADAGSDGDCVRVADVNQARLLSVRANLPSLRHRRL